MSERRSLTKRIRHYHPRFEQLENRLCLSSISGSVWHDLDSDGTRESFVSGDEPDVVMVIDESSSTDNSFGRVGLCGQIEVDEAWSTGISVTGFFNPVIIVSPVSYADSAPAVTSVYYDKDESIFQIRVDEWDYLDENHDDELLNYLVIEAGQHQLDDGTIIEAGMIEVDSDGTWVSFDETFETTPIIFTQVMTSNGVETVTARVSSLSIAGFSITLQEEEAGDGIHVAETVGYIAITSTGSLQSGSGKTYDGLESDLTFQVGTTSVDSTWDTITYENNRFSTAPFIFASIQTTTEADTAALRYQNASSTGVQLMVQEDRETTHTSETVGFLAIESGENGEIWVDVDSNHMRDTIFEAEIAACEAVNQKLIDLGMGDVADVVITVFDSDARYVDLDTETSGMQFHTTPNADSDDSGVSDVEEALNNLAAGNGSTQFIPPLLYAYEAMSDGVNPYAIPSDNGLGSRYAVDPYDPIRSNGNVLFLSDGNGHGDCTAIIGDPNDADDTDLSDWADNIRAFGVGQNAVLGDLNDPEAGSLRQIDSTAELFMTPYGLIQAMVNAIDTDGDGERDYAEPGMSGIVVYIDADNDGVRDVGETWTTTDANGLYSFESLGAGIYVVRQEVPTGFIQTFPASGAAQVITIAANEDKYNVNFGNNYATAVTVNDSAETDEDEPVAISVLANDTVPSGKTLYFSRVNQPEHGTATWDSSQNKIIYTPDMDWNGTDAFSYVLTLGDGLYFKSTVTVTVNPMLDGPKVLGVAVGNILEMCEIGTGTDNTQLKSVDLDDGVDRVTITFDRAITTVAVDDLKLLDRSADNLDNAITPVSFYFSNDNQTITWLFSGDRMMEGEIIMELSDSILADGFALDGEWTNPVTFNDNVGNSTFDDGQWSGDGTPGGDFVFCFTLPNTLLGDAYRDGVVDGYDSAVVSANWQEGPEMNWSDGDFNGDGYIDDIDANILAANWGQYVWQTYAFDAYFEVAVNETISDYLFGLNQGLGYSLTYRLEDEPEHGNVVVNSDGSFIYTPDTDYNGMDIFSFETFDGVVYSDAGTITIYVGDAPAVMSVKVKNSSTQQEQLIPTVASGDDQLMPVPIYSGINQVIITFDRTVTATQADLKLNGCDATAFSMNGAVCTWTFSGPVNGMFKYGDMSIVLSDAVNAGNIPLDGEWTSPDYFGDNTNNSTFAGGLTSGDGHSGGDFEFDFSMLLNGDANCDGIVNDIDATILAINYGYGPGATWNRGDFNGDGYVSAADFQILATNSGRRVWPMVAYAATFDVPSEVTTLYGNLAGKGDGLTYQLVGNASHGSATINADGTFSYTPTSGWNGVDTFTFRVADGSERSSAATVTLYVGDAPRVVGVKVGNSVTQGEWEINTAADGDDQLMPVAAYSGINQIIITFDRPVSAVVGDLTLNGYTADTCTPDANSTTYTWTFSQNFTFGGMTIVLSDAVNASGLALDGDWTNPMHYNDNSDNSMFSDGLGNGQPSGNLQRGGDFVFKFSMLLPGDANCDGIVDELDSATLAKYWLQSGTWAEGDFDGDGIIDDDDATLLAANWLMTVWPAA